jgi:CHAD domain-containing protein
MPTAEPTPVSEVEWKFAVGDDLDLPALLASGGLGMAVKPNGAVHLSATYFDADDLRLARCGVTLRRREGGDDAGWHLKLPLRRRERVELRLPLGVGSEDDVPAALGDLVTPYVRNAPLMMVARIETDRHRMLLVDDHGRVLAELADDAVMAYREGAVIARFREVELEVLDADPALRKVVKVLQREGAVPIEVPKLVRALGERALAPPDVERRSWPRPADPAGEAVRAHLSKHLRRLMLADVDVRRGQPDGVHQVRVAARQLRSGLKAFAPLVDENWATGLHDELGWLADAMGAARDTEVLQRRLLRHAAELSEPQASRAAAVIDATLQPRLASALDDARSTLRCDRHRSLLEALVTAAASPQLTKRAKHPCDDVLPGLVDEAWKRLAKRAARLDAAGNTQRWHRTRLAAKSARYTAELALPIFGRNLLPLAEGAAEVTDLLGEEHDAAVAQDALAVLAATPGIDGAGGYALGLVAHVAAADQRCLREHFLKRWPRIERAARA